MLSLVLLVGYFESKVFAGNIPGSNQNDSCTDVYLTAPGGSMQNVPRRNQHSTGICFAEAVAQAHDAYRFSQGGQTNQSVDISKTSTSAVRLAFDYTKKHESYALSGEGIDGAYDTGAAFDDLASRGGCDRQTYFKKLGTKSEEKVAEIVNQFIIAWLKDQSSFKQESKKIPQIYGQYDTTSYRGLSHYQCIDQQLKMSAFIQDTELRRMDEVLKISAKYQQQMIQSLESKDIVLSETAKLEVKRKLQAYLLNGTSLKKESTVLDKHDRDLLILDILGTLFSDCKVRTTAMPSYRVQHCDSIVNECSPDRVGSQAVSRAYFDLALKNKTSAPIVIGVNAEMFWNKNYQPTQPRESNHAVIVIGRRKNKAGVCEYLIRDSRVPEHIKGSDSTLSKNIWSFDQKTPANPNADSLDFWVSSDALFKGMKSYWYITPKK